jgi:hypothetical protein
MLIGSCNVESGFRTITHNKSVYLDLNYITFTFETVNDAAEYIHGILKSKYIYSAYDYKSAIRNKEGVHFVKPSKVIKLVNKDVIEGSYKRFVSSVSESILISSLTEKGFTQPYSKIQIDECLNSFYDLAFEGIDLITEVLDRESMIPVPNSSQYIYSKSEGLPIIVLDSNKRGSTKISILLDLFRLDPVSVLKREIENLGKFVKKDTKIPIIVESEFETVIVKPRTNEIPHGTNYVKKKTVTHNDLGIFSRLDNFGNHDEDSLDVMDEIDTIDDLNSKTLSNKYKSYLKDKKIYYPEGIDTYYAKMHLEKNAVHPNDMMNYIK